MTLLLLKVLLAPCAVVAATVAARRFGVRVGGLVGGLPTIAGPILLVLALAHGRTFAAQAAAATLLGMVALGAFVVVYVAVCRRFAWPVAVLASWGSFGVVTLALRPLQTGAVAAYAIANGALAVTLALLPRGRAAAAPPPRPRPRWDLPLRAAFAAVPVLAVTSAAGALGPHLSGLLTTFPVVTAVLAAFTHAHEGSPAVARLLRAMTYGFLGYGLFCFCLALALRRLGVGPAFALATVVAVGAHGAAIALAARRERALAAEPAA